VITLLISLLARVYQNAGPQIAWSNSYVVGAMIQKSLKESLVAFNARRIATNTNAENSCSSTFACSTK